MTTNPVLDLVLLNPLARIGRAALDGVAYLGGLASLAAAAARSIVVPGERSPAFGPAVARQLAWMIGMGLPLVGLVHVGLGSFLSMQAYFGGTFVDGTGAVVGVGLIRNVAAADDRAGPGRPDRGEDHRRSCEDGRGSASTPSRAGSPTAPTATRRRRPRPGPTRPAWPPSGSSRRWSPGRCSALGDRRRHGRRLAGRAELLGVSTHAFFPMFSDMLWFRDVVGVVVKGTAFALFAALFACHEGLRGPAGPDPASVPAAACRAACLAALAILVLNSGWFLLVYHAGPAFGPTLLAPPGPDAEPARTVHASLPWGGNPDAWSSLVARGPGRSGGRRRPGGAARAARPGRERARLPDLAAARST